MGLTQHMAVSDRRPPTYQSRLKPWLINIDQCSASDRRPQTDQSRLKPWLINVRPKPARVATKAKVTASTSEVKRKVGHVTQSRDFESRLAVG